MKKNYKSITTLIALLCLVTFNLCAQLSGVVTINSGAPASSTNYQTFSALAATLNTSGVSGPLTVNVVALSGPYNEQPSFGVISGVSPTNTITINGNGNVLAFTTTVITSAWTLNLNGADYMSINNLTVVASSSTTAYACVLNSNADYNTFTSCTFSCLLTPAATSQYAVMINGNNSGTQTNGNSANYTTFKDCSMIGGYYGIYLTGPNAVPPYATNNIIDNCIIRDFYAGGIGANFQTNLIVRRCTIDRPTRNITATTVYGVQNISTQNALYENNLIEKLYDGQLIATGTCYGFNLATTASVVGVGYNTFRNNVIRDIKFNGALYGFYGSSGGSANGYIHHNTISLDHTGSVSTGSTVGIYISGNVGYLTDVKNNCVSITRGGAGGKFCLYNNTIGYASFDYNNYYLNAANGINYLAYYGITSCTNLAALQSLGLEANGMSTDPQFTSLPSNLIPTSITMNDHGTPVGIVTDYLNLNRSGSNPDIGAYEYLSTNCSGVTTTASIAAASQTLCYGETANLLLNGATSDIGIVYQWLSSTNSAAGPWTVIPNATTAAYTTPPTTGNVYYGVEIKCLNGSITTTVSAVVNIASTTTSSVPYYEGFENIAAPNKLPNCSWSASDLGIGCLTYTGSFYMGGLNTSGRIPHTGTKFASFFWSPIGDKYYYTNGIQLNAGVTYSAGLWYQTDNNLYNNFADMSILIGTSQSTSGLISIASTNGPAASAVYKPLSNTFTVATSGIYYIAVRSSYPFASSTANAQYLNWDDLSVTVPCSLNTPSITVNASSNTICATQSVVLTASGADDFLWNTGAITNTITEYPNNSTLYSVNGTSTLSGCSNTVSYQVVVNPTPNVMAIAANASSVCAGSSINLTATGNAVTYTWSTGSSNLIINVTPSSSTGYTLTGSSSFGCLSKSILPITVVNAPTVNATSSTPTICTGESSVLTATGAITYVWVSGSSGSVLSGTSVKINPLVTTIYTVTGTNAAGCSGEFTLTQNVNECLGLNQISTSLNGVKIYPNPSFGEFSVELNNSSLKTIDVIDLTGRVLFTNSSTSDVVKINLNGLANGIYYIKVQSNNAVEVVKVVKQ